MNFRRQHFGPGRCLATLAGLAVVCGAVAGEPIRFSKPKVPLAAPPKSESDLPEIRDRGLEFASPNFDAAPVAPPRPPPMLRKEDRDEEQDRTHRLLRTPAIFTDPDEEKARKEARKNPLAKPLDKKDATSPFTKDLANQMRPDQSRSLAPVTDLDWQPGDIPGAKKENRRSTPGTATAYGRQDNFEAGPQWNRPGTPFEFTRSQSQEKLTPAQKQRRADFEQLLNPNAGPAGRAPNSLQPVANVADAKAAALAVPTINTGYDPNKSDPTKALQLQQQRLRGPVLEDINRRYNNQPAANESSSSAASATTPLLMRPSTSREFPTRKY